ncbi:MAG: 50S ribosomal protein L25 [Tissierellia bacterium]|nr:50S ribosomal protein L25 [Tissierellia bacterium]
MAAIKLQVEKRSELGKNRVDKLRQAGLIPGVLYSKGEDSRHIQVDRSNFDRVYRTAGMSTLVDLELDGNVEPVLIKEVQTHPFRDIYLHVDFQKLDMTQKVRLTIPISLHGRDNIEDKELILVQQLDEIEIECLPGDIPQSIDVDVSGMDLNTPVFVSDLSILENEDITIFREIDDVIASLIEPVTEEELEELDELDEIDELDDAADVPVIGDEDEEEQEEDGEE